MVYDERLKMTVSTLLLLFACFCLASPATIQENEPGVIKVVVEEGRDAILPCLLSTKEDIEKSLFDWTKGQEEVFLYEGGDQYNNGREGQDEQFKDRVFHFPEELKNGNASIVIKNTRISDSGIYTCAFPNLPPNGQKFQIELAVGPINKDRSGKIKGAARKPYITSDVTEDGLLLQCEVQDAYPKPEVEWQDSAGNILPAKEPQEINRGDRYDVTLLTTVTKSDRFRCVVKQKEINHEIFYEIYMPFPEKGCEDWAAWFFGGSFFGAAVLAAVLAVVLALLVATKSITISRNKGSPPQTNGSCNGTSLLQHKAEPHQNETGESNGVV